MNGFRGKKTTMQTRGLLNTVVFRGVFLLTIAFNTFLLQADNSGHVDRYDAVELYYLNNQNTRIMDNHELLLSAERLLDTSGAEDHQLSNNLWLHKMNDNFDEDEGSDAINRLAQAMFKDYWNHLKQNEFNHIHALPDGEGNWDNTRGLDYGVRLSGDTFSLKMDYEF